MSPITVGTIGMVVLFILLLCQIPIAVVMAIVGFLGFSYLVSVDAGLALMGTEPFLNADSYNLSVIPLFILMGTIAFISGLGQDFYKATYKWMGQVRGGLAMATIAACACFAAVCGSSPATAATMGAVALPEMKRFQYAPSLATGSVAAGGTLGILIPPSVVFIIYGILTQQSIGKLFLAGIFPGILLATLFIVATYIITLCNSRLGPAGPRTRFKEKVLASGGFVGMVIIFVLIMGGFFMGFFTPTEAGGVGVVGVLLLGLARRRITRKGFVNALFDAIRTTAMIFFILIGTQIFCRFLAVTRIPYELASYLGGLPVSPVVIMACIFFMYLILGCLIDSLSMMLLTVPIIYPVILTLGFDPIWFGVIMVLVIEAGLITPPVGVNVYVIKGIAEDVDLTKIFLGILPFLGAMAVTLAILLAFPQVALFLPNLMK